MDIDAVSMQAVAAQDPYAFDLVLDGDGCQVEMRLREVQADRFTFDLYLRRFGESGFDEVRVGGHPIFEARQAAIDAGVTLAVEVYRSGW
ncbi:hypothetical protein RBI14_20985 [Alcaligenaceae bacterium B3P038]|nr:hypothetical protein [Alcaligenaceae bacterium B3P038]